VRLAPLVVAACHEFGWAAFARELRQRLTARPDESDWLRVHERQEIPYRELEWLAAFCLDEATDSDKAALAGELCALAVARFCTRFPTPAAGYRPLTGHEPSVSETTLPLLLKALLAGNRDEELSRVIGFVEEFPDEFRLGECQVPSLKALVPWSRRRLGAVHPRLVAWFASVRLKLESATAKRPAPPADWTRPADVACTCPYCARLKAFLADPANGVGRIAAREDLRRHLIGMIARHGCDVKHALERKGSPYSLVLTKTTGSFERATARFEANCRLLKILDEVGKSVPLREGERKVKRKGSGGSVLRP